MNMDTDLTQDDEDMVLIDVANLLPLSTMLKCNCSYKTPTIDFSTIDSFSCSTCNTLICKKVPGQYQFFMNINVRYRDPTVHNLIYNLKRNFFIYFFTVNTLVQTETSWCKQKLVGANRN